MRSHFELDPGAYGAQRAGHLQEARIALIEDELDGEKARGELVVDIGCGPGDVVARLAEDRPDLDFVGLDIDRMMVAHARRAHPGSNLQFDASMAASVPGARARLVYCIDVLHHISDLQKFLGEVATLLVPRGLFVAIEPNIRNPYIWLHQERMRRRGLDEDHFRGAEFERDLAATGRFEAASHRTAFLVPGAFPPLPVAVTWIERKLERIPVLGGSVVYRARLSL